MGRLVQLYRGQTHTISRDYVELRAEAFTLSTAHGRILDTWARLAGLPVRGIHEGPSAIAAPRETDDTYRKRLLHFAVSQYSALEGYRGTSATTPYLQIREKVLSVSFTIAYDYDPGPVVSFARDEYDKEGGLQKVECSPTDYVAAALENGLPDVTLVVHQLESFYTIPPAGGVSWPAWSALRAEHMLETSEVIQGARNIVMRPIGTPGVFPLGMKNTWRDLLCYVACVVQCALCAKWASFRDRLPGSMFCLPCGLDLMAVGLDIRAEEAKYLQVRGMVRPAWLDERENFFREKILQAAPG